MGLGHSNLAANFFSLSVKNLIDIGIIIEWNTLIAIEGRENVTNELASSEIDKVFNNSDIIPTNVNGVSNIKNNRINKKFQKSF